MKKIISIVVLVSVLAGCLVLPAAASRTFVAGDANGDGAVDMKDSLAIRLYCAGAGELESFDAADLNADGKVNAKDLRIIKRHLADVEDLTQVCSIHTIAGNDIGNYTIVVTNPDNANMLFAAEELQKYVKMATDKELPIVENESDAELKVILCEDDSDALGNDGFAIVVEDGQLVITAGALRGSMYAVYELLEEYMGFRFFGYEDVRVPKDEGFRIPEGLEDTQIPDTLYRCNCVDP